MKKILIIAAVVLVVVAGVYLSRFAVLSNPWLDGEQGEAIRGDLVIPVTATGMIEPARLILIKSKASGQVKKIHVREGQHVQAGMVLVELDQVDEKRNVEARQADLDRAKSALEKARIALQTQEKHLPLQTILAEAALETAQARLAEAEYRWKEMQGFIEKEVAASVEKVTTEAAFIGASASRKQAQAELDRAKANETLLLESAREDVRQAEAMVDTAEKGLDEAMTKLDETIVRAKGAGMVYKINVSEGEMIQSGTMSLTGGTALMQLADTGAMFVRAQVDEADIGAIREIAPQYARPGYTEALTDEAYAKIAEALIESAKAAVMEKTKDKNDAAQTPAGGGDASSETEAPEPGAAAAQNAVAAAIRQLEASAPEKVREMIGRPVEVTVEAFAEETYQGVIERILPEPQRVNNVVSFNVLIRLVGADLEKLMGLQADLSFTTEEKSGVVMVKNESLFSEGRKCFVYRPKPDPGRPALMDEEKVPVRIGATDGIYTEIIEGLAAGDKIWIKRPQRTQREQEEADKG